MHALLFILALLPLHLAKAADCMQIQIGQYGTEAAKNKPPTPSKPTETCHLRLNGISQTCQSAIVATNASTQKLAEATQQKVGSKEMGSKLGAADSAADTSTDYSVRCTEQAAPAQQACKDPKGQELLTQLQSACMQNAASAKDASDRLQQAKKANDQLQGSSSSSAPSSQAQQPPKPQQPPQGSSTPAKNSSSRSSRKSSSSRSSISSRASNNSSTSVRMILPSSSSVSSVVNSSAASSSASRSNSGSSSGARSSSAGNSSRTNPTLIDVDEDGNPRDAGQIYPR